MKMVSAAKYNRAERDLKQARPLGAGTKVFYEQAEIQALPEEPKKLLIAVTSDRGLCGAVHTGVSRNIQNRLEDRTERENTKIICIGDKSRAILQRLFAKNILFVASEVGRKPPTFNDAAEIAIQLINSGYVALLPGISIQEEILSRIITILITKNINLNIWFAVLVEIVYYKFS